MTLRSIRARIEIYSRRRWTDAELHEREIGIMGGAVLVALMMMFMVWGGRG